MNKYSKIQIFYIVAIWSDLPEGIPLFEKWSGLPRIQSEAGGKSLSAILIFSKHTHLW